MVVYTHESQPPQKNLLGELLVEILFFFTPLKHQDKLVNKADNIYSCVLYTWVKNMAVGEIVSEYYPTCDLYVVENAVKFWTGLEFKACEVDSTLVVEWKRCSAFPH